MSPLTNHRVIVALLAGLEAGGDIEPRVVHADADGRFVFPVLAAWCSTRFA